MNFETQPVSRPDSDDDAAVVFATVCDEVAPSPFQPSSPAPRSTSESAFDSEADSSMRIEQPTVVGTDAFAPLATRPAEETIIELELAVADDEPPTSRRSLIPAIIASVLLHVWLLLTFKNILLPEVSTEAAVLETRIENKDLDEPNQPIDYELANPQDRELEVRKVINARSIGLQHTPRPQPRSKPELLANLDLRRHRQMAFDIPEGLEVDERLVVNGTTGEAIIQLESALDRVTWEIAQNLEERKVLVVWLLDASGSLRQQRQTISKRLRRIYGELDALRESGQIPRLDQPLLTGVVSYGMRTHFLTPAPTDRFSVIQQAVSGLTVDESGRENVFTAVRQVMQSWGRYRTRNGRRIMLIVVTDESGDDFEAQVSAINLCRRYGTRAYVIGPAAVFGRRKGYVPYLARENGKTYQLPVDLGPETARYELVDLPFWFDGPQFRNLSAGFPPYALARLVTETGGIYFTTNMTTMAGLARVGRFNAQAMKAFEPDYRFGTPAEFDKDLQKHPLRAAVIRAARLSRQFKPERTPTLDLRVTPANFRQTASTAQQTVARTQYMLDTILSAFPAGLTKQYSQEPSARWRMSYALNYGRLLALKVRAMEYNYALANLKGTLTAQDVGRKSNHWIFRPDNTLHYATNYRRTAKQAEELLRRVLAEAPETPWGILAARELRHPFGLRVIQRFVPPPKPRARKPGPTKKRILLAPDRKKKRPPKKPAPKPKPPKLPRL